METLRVAVPFIRSTPTSACVFRVQAVPKKRSTVRDYTRTAMPKRCERAVWSFLVRFITRAAVSSVRQTLRRKIDKMISTRSDSGGDVCVCISGTFNPPHRGHVLMGIETASALKKEGIIRSPHRTSKRAFVSFLKRADVVQDTTWCPYALFPFMRII